MTSNKQKRKGNNRNKGNKKAQRQRKEQRDRQAMSRADWPARHEPSPDEPSHSPDDIEHDDDGAGDAVNESRRRLLLNADASAVTAGRRDDDLPFKENRARLERIRDPRGEDERTWREHDLGEPVQLDGSGGEDNRRLSPDGFVAAQPPPRPLVETPSTFHQPDPTPRPSISGNSHQDLIQRITEKLRDEAGLSPQAIADLLKRGAHLLPPPPEPDLPFRPPPVASAAVDTTPSIEPSFEQEVPRKMSPGILIPRHAGIKIRGVEPEPPLVDAPAPDKSKIVVASQYLFQHDLEAAGMMDERDVQGRLQGIQVIEAGRRGLRMPMKTYGTACVFFMRYRYHVATKGAEDDAAGRYDFRDAALASLWLASKAEETPKKSKEILCAFRNTTLPPEEHLTPDDEIFENQAKLMINLERYLLEIVAFDFRARNCGELLAGLMVEMGSEERVVKVAMAVALDLYRTLAVLKQTRQTLALACIEMASRFVQADTYVPADELYTRVGTTRQEVLETLFDLIELYLNHHAITAAGSKYNINDFMRVSTTLRTEMKAKGYARYTYMQEARPSTSPTTSPLHTDAKSTPTLIGTPQTPANRDADRRDAKKRTSPKDTDKILVEEKDIELGKPVSPPPAFLLASPGRSNGHYGGHSPTSPTSPTSAEQTNPDDPSQVKEVVRFVLDAARARDEDLLRRPFHQIEKVEVTEHHTLYIPRDGSSEQAEVEMAKPAPTSPSSVRNTSGPLGGAGKMRNGSDVEMRDAPLQPPLGPSGPRGMPPMGPRWDRERDERRDRERERDRDGYRRRSPPRMYGRDERYGRRDDRRW